MQDNINAEGIKINVEDIKKFLSNVGILQETQSNKKEIRNNSIDQNCHIVLFINGQYRRLIMSIQDLESVKTWDNNKIDEMSIDFPTQKYERKVLLKLCRDSEENLYFEYQKERADIYVREFTPKIYNHQIKSIKINCTDLRQYLLSHEVKENEVNDVYVKTTVNGQKSSPQELKGLLVVKSYDAQDIDFVKLSFVSQQTNLQKKLSDFTLVLKKDNSDFYFENRKNNQKTNVGFTINANKLYETIHFSSIASLVYKISHLKNDFVDWSDAKDQFQFITFAKNAESDEWIKNEIGNEYLDNNFNFFLYPQCQSILVGGIKIFFRHENYKNISSQKDIEVKDMKMNDLSKYGFFEMDLKENHNGNGAYFELTDQSGNHICYAGADEKKISELNDDSKFLNKKNEFIQKFAIKIHHYRVFGSKTEGYCCDDIIRFTYLFLNKGTRLTFAPKLFDKSKNGYLRNSIVQNNFYVSRGSTTLKNILDVFFKQKCLPCDYLAFIDDKTIDHWDYNKSIDDNLYGNKSVALRISDFTFDENINTDNTNNFDFVKNELNTAKNGLDFVNKFCKLLSELKKSNSKFDFDLYSSDDIFINDVEQIYISKQQIGHSIFIFNPDIGLKFDKALLDSDNFTTKFYILEKSQASKDISNFVSYNQKACIEIYYMQNQLLEYYISNDSKGVFYKIHDHILSNLSNANFIRQSLFNIKSLNLSFSEIEVINDFEDQINLLSEQDIKKYLEELKNSDNTKKNGVLLFYRMSDQCEQNIKKCLTELINSMLELKTYKGLDTTDPKRRIYKKIKAVIKYLLKSNHYHKKAWMHARADQIILNWEIDNGKKEKTTAEIKNIKDEYGCPNLEPLTNYEK